MITVQLDAPGTLTVRDTPTPVPAPGEVLVRFEASAINPADLKIRNGAIVPRKGEYPFVLGWDLVGRVVGLGQGTEGPSEGTRVFGMSAMAATGRGTWSEFVALPASSVTAAPESVEPAVLAQLPLVGITALKAVDDLAATAGQQILVAGATGAVGGLVVQLLLLQGLEVHALVRHESQADPVRAAGVKEVHVGSVPANSFDGIIDAAGIDVSHALRPGGLYVSVVPGTQPSGEVMNGKSGKVVVIAESGERLAILAGLVEDGSLTLSDPTTFQLQDIEQAYEAFEARSGSRVTLVL